VPISDFILPSGERLQVETQQTGLDVGFQSNSSVPDLDLARALMPLRSLCEVVLERLRGLTEMPDSVELTLGVTLSAEGSLIVAKGKAESNLGVKITFKKQG